MNKKTTKTIKPNQSSTERLIESTLLRAKAIKATAEESMKKELLESFSPMMKKTISNHLAEMEDFEMEDDDELSEEESVEEVEGMEEFEDLNEEESEETEEETEVVDEAPVEEFEAEEAEEVLEEGESDEDAEFLAELERLLSEGEETEVEETEELTESEEGEEDAEELNEGEELDDLNESEEEEELTESEVAKELDNSFRGAMTEAKRKKLVKEGKDGGVYTGKGGKADPYSGKATDKNDVYTLRAENKRLKETLSKINNQLAETDMDSKRLRELSRLSKSYKLTEAMKLKVMRNVDSAKNERELKLVVESMENTFRKSSSFKGSRLKENTNLRRNTAGKASSVKPMARKAINEGASRIIDTDLVNQWAHLAGLDDKN